MKTKNKVRDKELKNIVITNFFFFIFISIIIGVSPSLNNEIYARSKQLIEDAPRTQTKDSIEIPRQYDLQLELNETIINENYPNLNWNPENILPETNDPGNVEIRERETQKISEFHPEMAFIDTEGEATMMALASVQKSAFEDVLRKHESILCLTRGIDIQSSFQNALRNYQGRFTPDVEQQIRDYLLYANTNNTFHGEDVTMYTADPVDTQTIDMVFFGPENTLTGADRASFNQIANEITLKYRWDNEDRLVLTKEEYDRMMEFLEGEDEYKSISTMFNDEYRPEGGNTDPLLPPRGADEDFVNVSMDNRITDPEASNSYEIFSTPIYRLAGSKKGAMTDPSMLADDPDGGPYLTGGWGANETKRILSPNFSPEGAYVVAYGYQQTREGDEIGSKTASINRSGYYTEVGATGSNYWSDLQMTFWGTPEGKSGYQYLGMSPNVAGLNAPNGTQQQVFNLAQSFRRTWQHFVEYVDEHKGADRSERQSIEYIEYKDGAPKNGDGNPTAKIKSKTFNTINGANVSVNPPEIDYKPYFTKDADEQKSVMYKADTQEWIVGPYTLEYYQNTSGSVYAAMIGAELYGRYKVFENGYDGYQDALNHESAQPYKANRLQSVDQVKENYLHLLNLINSIKNNAADINSVYLENFSSIIEESFSRMLDQMQFGETLSQDQLNALYRDLTNIEQALRNHGISGPANDIKNARDNYINGYNTSQLETKDVERDRKNKLDHKLQPNNLSINEIISNVYVHVDPNNWDGILNHLINNMNGVTNENLDSGTLSSRINEAKSNLTILGNEVTKTLDALEAAIINGQPDIESRVLLIAQAKENLVNYINKIYEPGYLYEAFKGTEADLLSKTISELEYVLMYYQNDELITIEDFNYYIDGVDYEAEGLYDNSYYGQIPPEYEHLKNGTEEIFTGRPDMADTVMANHPTSYDEILDNSSLGISANEVNSINRGNSSQWMNQGINLYNELIKNDDNKKDIHDVLTLIVNDTSVLRYFEGISNENILSIIGDFIQTDQVRPYYNSNLTILTQYLTNSGSINSVANGIGLSSYGLLASKALAFYGSSLASGSVYADVRKEELDVARTALQNEVNTLITNAESAKTRASNNITAARSAYSSASSGYSSSSSGYSSALSGYNRVISMGDSLPSDEYNYYLSYYSSQMSYYSGLMSYYSGQMTNARYQEQVSISQYELAESERQNYSNASSTIGNAFNIAYETNINENPEVFANNLENNNENIELTNNEENKTKFESNIENIYSNTDHEYLISYSNIEKNDRIDNEFNKLLQTRGEASELSVYDEIDNMIDFSTGDEDLSIIKKIEDWDFLIPGKTIVPGNSYNPAPGEKFYFVVNYDPELFEIVRANVDFGYTVYTGEMSVYTGEFMSFRRVEGQTDNDIKHTSGNFENPSQGQSEIGETLNKGSNMTPKILADTKKMHSQPMGTPRAAIWTEFIRLTLTPGTGEGGEQEPMAKLYIPIGGKAWVDEKDGEKHFSNNHEYGPEDNPLVDAKVDVYRVIVEASGSGATYNTNSIVKKEKARLFHPKTFRTVYGDSIYTDHEGKWGAYEVHDVGFSENEIASGLSPATHRVIFEVKYTYDGLIYRPVLPLNLNNIENVEEEYIVVDESTGGSTGNNLAGADFGYDDLEIVEILHEFEGFVTGQVVDVKKKPLLDYWWHDPAYPWTYTSYHRGTDYIFKNGYEYVSGDVYAAANGTVVQSLGWVNRDGNESDGGGWGNHVIINHGMHGGKNVYTVYAHLKYNTPIAVGTRVTRGQKIGEIGNTGISAYNHLHLEININGTSLANKTDAFQYFSWYGIEEYRDSQHPYRNSYSSWGVDHITATKDIKATTRYVDNPLVAAGVINILQEGSAGKETINFTIDSKSQQVTSINSRNVTQPMIERVIERGTGTDIETPLVEKARRLYLNSPEKFSNYSKVIENPMERDELNRMFAEIEGQQPIDSQGGVSDHTGNHANNIDRTTQTTIEYNEIAPDNANGYWKSEIIEVTAREAFESGDENKMRRMISASTLTYDLPIPISNNFYVPMDAIENKEADKTQNFEDKSVEWYDGSTIIFHSTEPYTKEIDLGVMDREYANVSVVKDLESATLVVNRKAQSYKFGRGIDFDDNRITSESDPLVVTDMIDGVPMFDISIQDMSDKYEINNLDNYVLDLYKADYIYRTAMYGTRMIEEVNLGNKDYIHEVFGGSDSSQAYTEFSQKLYEDLLNQMAEEKLNEEAVEGTLDDTRQLDIFLTYKTTVINTSEIDNIYITEIRDIYNPDYMTEVSRNIQKTIQKVPDVDTDEVYRPNAITEDELFNIPGPQVYENVDLLTFSEIETDIGNDYETFWSGPEGKRAYPGNETPTNPPNANEQKEYGIFLEKGKKADLYTTYRLVRREDHLDIDGEGNSLPDAINAVIDKDHVVTNVAEVGSYASYSPITGKASAKIDINSAPGNMKEEFIRNAASVEEIMFREDDTGVAPGLIIRIDEDDVTKEPVSERNIDGVVFEDSRNEDIKVFNSPNPDPDSGVVKTGNGIYEPGEGELPLVNQKVVLEERISVRADSEIGRMFADKMNEIAASEGNTSHDLGFTTDMINTSSDYVDIPFVWPTEVNVGTNTINLKSATGLDSAILTDENGRYNYQGIFAGAYVVKVPYTSKILEDNNGVYDNDNPDHKITVDDLVKTAYADDPDRTIKWINGIDFKSTYYRENDPTPGGSIDNLNETWLPKERPGEENLSYIRDDEFRRIEILVALEESFNTLGRAINEMDKENKDDIEEDLLNLVHSRGNMVATTPKISMTIENLENEDIRNKLIEADDLESLIKMFQQNSGTYVLPGYSEDKLESDYDYSQYYYVKDVNAGLVQRPLAKMDLRKELINVTVESNAGDLLMDLKYTTEKPKRVDKTDLDNSVNNYEVSTYNVEYHKEFNEEESIGYEHALVLDNFYPTNYNPEEDNSSGEVPIQGLVYLNIDNNLLQGAVVKARYKITAVNLSEPDIIDRTIDPKVKDMADKGYLKLKAYYSGPIETDESKKLYHEIETEDLSYGSIMDEKYYKRTTDVVEFEDIDTATFDQIIDIIGVNTEYDPESFSRTTIEIIEGNKDEYSNRTMVDGSAIWDKASKEDLINRIARYRIENAEDLTEAEYINEAEKIMYPDEHGLSDNNIYDHRGLAVLTETESHIYLSQKEGTTTYPISLLGDTDFPEGHEHSDKKYYDTWYVGTVRSIGSLIEEQDTEFENTAELISYTIRSGKRFRGVIPGTIFDTEQKDSSGNYINLTEGQANTYETILGGDPAKEMFARTSVERDASTTEKITITPPTGLSLYDQKREFNITLVTFSALGIGIFGIILKEISLKKRKIE